MNDTRYTPPSAPVADPALVPGAKQRPRQVVLAIQLAAAGYVLGLGVIALQWERYTTGIESPLSMLISQVIGLSISIFLWRKIYRGRNWARIVLLVLFLLSMANPVVLDLIRAAPLPAKSIMLGTAAINVVVLYLLFLTPGREWFRKT